MPRWNDRARHRRSDQPGAQMPAEAVPPKPSRRDPDDVLYDDAQYDDAQYLENLRAALQLADPELSARLVRADDRPPFLHVTNRAAGRLTEDVSVRAGTASCEPGHYLYSWGQPIGSVDDPEGAAAALLRVLAVRGPYG